MLSLPKMTWMPLTSTLLSLPKMTWMPDINIASGGGGSRKYVIFTGLLPLCPKSSGQGCIFNGVFFIEVSFGNWETKETLKKSFLTRKPRSHKLFLTRKPRSHVRIIYWTWPSSTSVEEPVKLTSDVKQRKQRSWHNNPNPNNSYKTKKKFTGSYTEVNPQTQSHVCARHFFCGQVFLFLTRLPARITVCFMVTQCS